MISFSFLFFFLYPDISRVICANLLYIYTEKKKKTCSPAAFNFNTMFMVFWWQSIKFFDLNFLISINQVRKRKSLLSHDRLTGLNTENAKNYPLPNTESFKLNIYI